MNLPDHPFWDYSLALYGRPGVAAACLRLQDGLGVDVNLLLFACWAATEGGGAPSPAGWRRLVDGTAAWRSRVVEPLRGVRQFLKDDETSSWSAVLRERVKALELEAEHVQQLAIAGLAEAVAGGTGDALAAMLDYVGALGLSPSGADRSDLSAIAAAAVAKAVES